MRHRIKKHLHFNKKDTAHRKSVVRNLVSAFFEHQSIVTTEKRAQAIVPVIDKLIGLAKGDHTQYNKIRLMAGDLSSEAASRGVFAVAEKLENKTSGYTRITPIKYRDGDAALLVKLEIA